MDTNLNDCETLMSTVSSPQMTFIFVNGINTSKQEAQNVCSQIEDNFPNSRCYSIYNPAILPSYLEEMIPIAIEQDLNLIDKTARKVSLLLKTRSCPLTIITHSNGSSFIFKVLKKISNPSPGLTDLTILNFGPDHPFSGEELKVKRVINFFFQGDLLAASGILLNNQNVDLSNIIWLESCQNSETFIEYILSSHSLNSYVPEMLNVIKTIALLARSLALPKSTRSLLPTKEI